MYKQTNTIQQAKTYPTNCTHHELHNNNENKIPVISECICNKWQNMMQNKHLMHLIMGRSEDTNQ